MKISLLLSLSQESLKRDDKQHGMIAAEYHRTAQALFPMARKLSSNHRPKTRRLDLQMETFFITGNPEEINIKGEKIEAHKDKHWNEILPCLPPWTGSRAAIL